MAVLHITMQANKTIEELSLPDYARVKQIGAAELRGNTYNTYRITAEHRHLIDVPDYSTGWSAYTIYIGDTIHNAGDWRNS